MAIIVNGYRSKENVGVSGFETIMKKIKDAIEKKQRSHYISLLSDEVNLVADYYTLNYLKINPGSSLLDVAKDRIAARIDEAIRASLHSTYNFFIAMQIMTFRKRWYFYIMSENEQISEDILAPVTELEKFTVEDSAESLTEEHEKIWNEIREKYTDGPVQPLNQSYYLKFPVNVDPADIKLHPKHDRVVYQAEATEFCSIYQAQTNGRQLTPVELMRYMDEIAIERKNPSHDSHVRELVARLNTILIDLTPEIISKPIGGLFANNEKTDDAVEEITDVVKES